MKKLTILCLFFALAGCNDYLNEVPEGQVVGTNAIQDIAGLEAALTGTYKGMLRTWARGFLTSAIEAYVMSGDNVTSLSGGNKAEFRQTDQFDVVSSNSRLEQIWSG